MNHFFGNIRLVWGYAHATAALAIAGTMAMAATTSSLMAQSILYVANQDDLDTYELYVWDGQAAFGNKLSTSLVDGGDVESVTSDKNGKVALYLADAEVDEQRELYAVDMKSGSVKKASGPLNPGMSVVKYAISDNGSDVVYKAPEQGYPYKLYHSNLKTGVVRQIGTDSVGEDNVLDFALSPKGGSLAFIAGNDSKPYELFLADLKSGAVRMISTLRTDDTDVVEVRYDEIGNNVFYTTLKIDKRPANDIPLGALYHHNIKSGETTQLPGTELGGYVQRFSVAAKGKAVAYVVQDHWEENVAILHHVDLKTRKNILVAATSSWWPFEGSRIFGIHACKIDRKGRYVGFTMGDRSEIGDLKLRIADTKTGLWTDVPGFRIPGERLWDFAGDKKWKTFFCLAYDSEQIQELYRVGIEDAAPVRVSLPLHGEADVYEAHIDPKFRYAVYDWGENYWGRKLTFLDTKSGTASSLNPHLTPGTGVIDYHVAGWERITGD